MPTAVPMSVADVRRPTDRPERYIVVLEEVGGERRLPIWIGMPEALSLVAIRLTWSALAEPIRTTRAIYRDQSAQLRRLLTSDSGRLLVLDPLLGWRYRAGHRDPENAMNSKGLRSLREYAPHPAASFSIWIFHSASTMRATTPGAIAIFSFRASLEAHRRTPFSRRDRIGDSLR